MFQKNGDFSKSDLQQLLRQPQAQELLLRLQQMDQTALQKAVELAFRGDTAGAKEAADLVLTHTNEESAIAELIERLERELPF